MRDAHGPGLTGGARHMRCNDVTWAGLIWLASFLCACGAHGAVLKWLAGGLECNPPVAAPDLAWKLSLCPGATRVVWRAKLSRGLG